MNRSRHIIVIAVAALLLAVSFAGGATAARMITGKQIKDGTVTSADIRDRTVTTRDVKDRSLKVRDLAPAARESLRGQQGPAGPTGAQGAQGLPGDDGEDGLQGLRGLPGADGEDGLQGLRGLPGADGVSGFEVVTRTISVGPGLTESVEAACPAGKKAVSASSSFPTVLSTLTSQVARVDDATFRATGLNGLLTARLLTLDLVCATVLP